MALMLALG